MYEAEELIDYKAKEFEEIFLISLINFKEIINIDNIEKSLNIFEKNLTHFRPVILSTISEAAKQAQKEVLDLETHQALNAVNKICNNLIIDITEQQKNVIKNILSSGINRGLSHKIISDKIKNVVGLNQQQYKILENIEKNLNSENVDESDIKRIIESKIKQFIKQRAETIAQTESARAVSEGRYLIQQQCYENGDFPTEVMQEWLTGRDERTCSICSPMHGQRIKLNELFTTGNGLKVKSPILHPRCRCIVRIIYKDKK